MRWSVVASSLVVLASTADAQTPPRPAEAYDSLGVVRFDPGSARVAPSSRKRLESIARGHARNGRSLLIVEGHASRTGSAGTNLRLSQQRADAVRRVLLQSGADPNRLVLVAYGESRADGPPSSERRVVIRATASFPELALEQSDPEIAEDARAARRATTTTSTTERRTTPAPRGRDGTTVVVVTGGAPAQGGATPPTAVPLRTTTDGAGIAARTSGGAGSSALTGIGVDPTAADTAPPPGNPPPVVVGGTPTETGGAGATGGGETGTSAPTGAAGGGTAPGR